MTQEAFESHHFVNGETVSHNGKPVVAVKVSGHSLIVKQSPYKLVLVPFAEIELIDGSGDVEFR